LIDEFRCRTSSSVRDLRETDAAALEIKCLTDAPIAYCTYRLTEPERRTVGEMIEEPLDNGIIRESKSPYASPINLLKKKKKTGD
jgi:hypothetical protein